MAQPHFSTILHRKESGAALVFVLAMLVLILVVVLAYFSNAIQNRQISSASASKAKVQFLSRAASAYILDDIKHEIDAGSVADTSGLTMKVKRPITITSPGVGVGITNMLAPSMSPQRVGWHNITNIVKVSRRGDPFFSTGPGYATPTDRPANGLARASAVSTDDASTNGRFLTKERWNRPKLMSDAEMNEFDPPDWIYLTRSGSNPTDFSESELTKMRSADPSNRDYVIGRYAYVIYDVGGLVDINVVGNDIDDGNDIPGTNNARRGLLHQVSLTNGIGGVVPTNFPAFVSWRSAVSSTNTNATAGSGGLFDPKRNFIDVPVGEQTLVNRQDLLNYAAQANSPIPSASLPFLTTFSRDLNAPSFEPNSSRSKIPATPDADVMNPALLSFRFAADTTLNRPDSGAITVKSGTPVMPRRFPLSKLSLFEQVNPDAAAMLYYFGLTKVGNIWRYTATVPTKPPDPPGGRIARLSEVPTLGREPNFFEILQAVIYTGSLGKTAPDTYTFEAAADALQNLQVMQIGANIIDQADAADRPTAIEYPSGNPGEFLTVYGVENLPYISQIGLVGWRPTDQRNLFQAWAVFDVWNPHQNAATLPVGVDGFRILPTGGLVRVHMLYSLTVGGTGSGIPAAREFASTLYRRTPALGGCAFSDSKAVLALNTGRNFTFSATANYSEPTTLGGTPTSSASTPGLLLAECSPGSAIPPQGSRLEAVQQTINGLMDGIAPYTATAPPPPSPPRSVDSRGRRVYPTGTTFTGLNPTYWLTEGPGGLTISGKYGTKAHNVFRLANNGVTADWGFVLQAHYTGDPASTWHTYQVFEGFGAGGQMDIANSPINGVENQTVMMVNTDHNAAGAPLQNEFYTWRSRGASVGMVKIDPRTNRLGFSGWGQGSGTTARNDFLGNSVRHSAAPLPPNFLTDYGGGLINNDFRWAVPGGMRMSGRDSSVDNYTLAPGFQLMSALLVDPPQRNRAKMPLFGLVSNSPDFLDATRPFRYSDPDGVVRPADGYFGTLPTVPGRIAERPLILNRPFRSVGELGYVFRDMPWKTIDFFSRQSGDLGLLDVFSVSDTDADLPLVAGRINLNTRQTAALKTILLNSAKQLPLTTSLSDAEAQTIADAIVRESTARPFLDRGDLVSRILNSGSGTDPIAGDTSKTAREATIRTLAEMGTTRTWNFLIDLVAQTGRFTAASKSGSDFMVQGEERVWIHVAIDRMTGEVLEIQHEVVNE